MIWVQVRHPRYDGAQLSPKIIKKSVVLHDAGFCDLCVAGIFSRPLIIGSCINQPEFWFGLNTFLGGPVSFFLYKPSRINFPGWFDYWGRQLTAFSVPNGPLKRQCFGSEDSEPHLVARFCQPSNHFSC